MNRRALLLVLALLLVSSSAFAYEEAHLSPMGLVLRVGESTDVEVGVHHLSGLTHYVWASSKSPCSSSAAEFRIDVLSSRRRAVGR